MRQALALASLPAITAALALLQACASIDTLPMHDPLSPTADEDVEFELQVEASDGVASVELHEQISTVDAAGTVVDGAEQLLQSWSLAGQPTSTTLAWTKAGGYPANRLVRYRFYVRNGDGKSRSHHVTFATRPYPVPNAPTPVYCQGDPEDALDTVFIPDADVTDLDDFRDQCRGMIRDGLFAESTIRFWSRAHNFYVNTPTGSATDYDLISTDGTHQLPSNWSNLSFAEGAVLMHTRNLRDYATGSLFSTELPNRGTMLHESGHALYDLADEYPGGVHWQEAVYPNNFASLMEGQNHAPSVGRTASDCVQMGTSGWYKLCVEDCHMRVSGLSVNSTGYDEPCEPRVSYVVIDNAVN